MIKDTRYIIRRVIIGVLISLILSFIYACDVKAETSIINPSSLNLIRYYGNTATTISNPNCNNNTCFWNDGQNATSYRWNTKSNLYYSNVNLVVFNIALWQSSGMIPYPITEVSFNDYPCYFIRTNNQFYADDSGVTENDNIGISALCPIKGDLNLTNGTKTANFTLNNTGTQGQFSKLSLSNISLIQDSELVSILNTLGSINSALSPIHNDLTYILQSTNNSAYWNEVNSGKLESIKTLLQNQTTSIQNSISSASQNEIDAANQNTQEQIESQEVCNYYDKNIIEIENKALNRNNGNLFDANNYGITKYIKINKTSKIKIISTDTSVSAGFCFYDINKDFISCLNIAELVENNYINIPNNTSYIRSTIRKTTNKPQFEICNNGNQATNDSINDVNDTLNDSSVDDPSNSLTDMDNKIATNSVISDLLLLPITLFQNVLNSINGTCSTFNLGSLLGTNLTLPCINLSNILGSSLYGVIDILLCGIFVLSMRKKFVDIFENITSLKDRGNELE